MSPPLKEARLILALEALQNDEELKLKAVAKHYNVASSTLCNRYASRPARRNILANLYNLIDLEEQMIV